MDAESDRTAEFTRALASLKRRGCNLLLVGVADGDAHLEACANLMGDADGDRRRLFSFTDRNRNVADRLPTVATDATVIDYASPTRGVTTATASASPDVIDARTLPELADAISTTIDDIQREATLDPAVFRFCLDSLRPLVEEYDERQVFRFLHAVTREIADVEGMAHYHLPVPRDDDIVRDLEPLFDAVVELRASPEIQQQWHLTAEDITTGWLPL